MKDSADACIEIRVSGPYASTITEDFFSLISLVDVLHKLRFPTRIPPAKSVFLGAVTGPVLRLPLSVALLIRYQVELHSVPSPLGASQNEWKSSHASHGWRPVKLAPGLGFVGPCAVLADELQLCLRSPGAVPPQQKFFFQSGKGDVGSCGRSVVWDAATFAVD